MKNLSNSLPTIGWHLIFWAILLLYEWLPNGSFYDNYDGFFYFACVNIPIVAAATYFTIFITVERFLLHKKMWQFALSLALSLIVFGSLRRVINHTFMYPVLFPNKDLKPLWYLPRLTIDAVYVHLLAGLGAIIFVIRKWMEQQRLNETLMKEKVAAELSLLRSQVQPHFIFNTLNNIYMLSLKKSAQTSEMIYRLSALLSYMLYDSKKSFIDIEKEIDYIKNYINLEKIRYGERLDVQMTVINSVSGVEIPPLLFLPLVENAFKHGVSNAVNDSWIHIDVSLKKKILIFKIENSIGNGQRSAENGFGNGLGLDNLKKRLLILYPDRHELKLLKDEDEGLHLAVLKLDFSQNTEGYEVFKNEELKIKANDEKPALVASAALAFKSLFLFLKF